MPITSAADRYNTTPQQPLSPWQTQPQQPSTVLSGTNAFAPPPPQQTAGTGAGQLMSAATRGTLYPQQTAGTSFGNDMVAPPSMGPTSPGMTAGTQQVPVFGQPPQQQPNALAPQGTRVQPSYLPENWDYHQSPEYQQRLAWAQRDLNRQLLSMGRSDSTGGINALARQQGEIAGQEIDKQYQRALAANMQNYGRYFGANVENYGRTKGEDDTGWNRAMQLDNVGFRNQGRDFSQNYQLADMGLRATTTGVQAGNATGANLANLLSQNGANQASLALSRGDVDAGTIKRLMDSGFGFDEIEKLFSRPGTASSIPGTDLGGITGVPLQPLPAYSGAGIGDPNGGQQYSGLPGVDWGIG